MTRVICCKCNHEYELSLFEDDKKRTFTKCPSCEVIHSVSFDSADGVVLVPIAKVRLKNWYASYWADRIADGSRVDQSGSDGGDVTDWPTTSPFCVCVMIYTNTKDCVAETRILRWRDVTDSGAFTALTSSGEMKTTTATDLTDGGATSSAEKICTVPSGYSYYSEFSDTECEDGSSSTSEMVGADAAIEIQFAVDPADADAGHQYEFELYSNTQSASIATLGSLITIAASGGVTVPVGLPSGAGAALPTTQLFDYIFSVGIPSGVGAPLAVTVAGNALVVAGLPSGTGATLAPIVSGAANVAVGLPTGIAQALSTTQLFDYVFSVGLPSGLGEALGVTVSVGGSELVVVGIPSGAGVALSPSVSGAALIAAGLPSGMGAALQTTQITGALVNAGLPAGLAEALSVIVSGAANFQVGLPSGLGEALSPSLSLGANVSVGLPSGAGEALPTTQLYDYVISLGIPSGAGVALPVTVYTDGGPAFTFYISQIVPLEE